MALMRVSIAEQITNNIVCQTAFYFVISYLIWFDYFCFRLISKDNCLLSASTYFGSDRFCTKAHGKGKREGLVIRP